MTCLWGAPAPAGGNAVKSVDAWRAQAALATSASQYTCMGLLLWALRRKRLLQARHLRSPPSFSTVAPLLRARPD